MKINWAAEACDQRYDSASGAMLTQLTSSGWSSINIYCEQPYTTPDSKRIAIIRKSDVSFDKGWRLIVGDLERLKLTMIESGGVEGVCNAAWSGLLHYTLDDGTMCCLNLATLEKKTIDIPDSMELRGRGASVSPDQRYIVYSKLVKGPEIAIVLADLVEMKETIIFQHPEITNPHLQFNPVDGKHILVQHNRGSQMDEHGNVIKAVSEQGTTHFVINLDGTMVGQLPAGPPHTGPSTGHSNFVADTGKVAWASHWDYSDWSLGLNQGGNLAVALPGDERPTFFEAPEHRFNHVNVSRCGTYFVCDSSSGSLYDPVSREIVPPCLVVGNLNTGKYATLVSNTGARNGGGQHQHPHAYMTADNRNVVFNSNYFGDTTQVWVARVPDGFLESLG